jgi:hypothetical protein
LEPSSARASILARHRVQLAARIFGGDDGEVRRRRRSTTGRLGGTVEAHGAGNNQIKRQDSGVSLPELTR